MVRVAFRPFPNLLTAVAATIVVALLGSACVASRSGTSESTEAGSGASAEQAILDALYVFHAQGSRGGAVGPAAALAALEEHTNAADPSERAMVQALLPVLRRAKGDEALAPADYRTVKDTMARMASRHASDFDIQLAMTTGMAAMELALKASGAEDDAGSVTRARALVARFGNQARAHAHLGQVLAGVGDDANAMRSFTTCLKLDPTMSSCKTDRQRSAERYQQPRCTSVPAGRFGLHAAFPANAATAAGGRRGLRTVTIDQRQLLMETKATIDGKGVESAEGISASGPANAANSPTVLLTLKPAATGKLAELTAKLAERQGFLALVIRGKVIQAPQVMSPVETGQLTIPGLDLGRLCPKLERRPLPL